MCFAAACSALVLAACNRGLPEREAELAALRKDEAHLTAQLNQLTRGLTTLQAATDAEQNRARAVAVQLKQTQVNTVALWKGEQATLEAKKKEARLTPALAAALDLAQSVAGGETVERRFVRGVEAKDLNELARLVEGWESSWLAQNDPMSTDEEEAAPKVCPANRTLSCTPIDDDSLWCPDPVQRSSWALLSSNGDLTVGRLVEGQNHQVEARLAPRVWLTRVGDPDDGAVFLHLVRQGRFVTQWQKRTNDEHDGRLEQLKANFDEDPFVEGLFWNKEDLLFADPTSRDDVTLLRDVQACEALEVLEGVPSPVRERCHTLRAPPAAVPLDAGTP